MKTHFSCWYSTEVKEALEQGQEITNVKVDLRASIVKLLHGNWLIMAFLFLKEKKNSIEKGKSEILSSITITSTDT